MFCAPYIIAALLAQSTEGPTWLKGVVEVPFEVVGVIVGGLITVGLVYFVRRVLRDRDAEQSQRERRSR